jgi:MFS family permease
MPSHRRELTMWDAMTSADSTNGARLTTILGDGAAAVVGRGAGVVRSLVPARLDRLPWSPFHWRVVIGLGSAWILDGLEIQIVNAAGTVLTDGRTLGLSTAEVGLLASVYLLGEVVGALFFARLADRVGRKRIFIVTLMIYLLASGISGLAFSFWFMAIFRFIAGTGIGGEYAAINSAIDELIPSHYRGRVDIGINGTYWAGAMIGAVASTFLLNPALLPIDVGWRIAFFLGPIIGIGIIYLRRVLPESPRWLMTHGREREAEETTDRIEEQVRSHGLKIEPVPASKALEVKARGAIGYVEIAKLLFGRYPSRSFLGFSLMVTQAFLYNAIFFTSGLVLATFYHVPTDQLGLYFFPFALGNLIGPLLLGGLFDTLGRRVMIAGTYCGSAILLAISGWLFNQGVLDATTQTILWCAIFFFASAGASAAYLTVSEIFPLELRAQAIAFFFAISQLAGGVAAPTIFGALIGDGTARGPLAAGYYLGAGLMFIGGLVAWFFGVNAERKALEDVASPLSAVARVDR